MKVCPGAEETLMTSLGLMYSTPESNSALAEIFSLFICCYTVHKHSEVQMFGIF